MGYPTPVVIDSHLTVFGPWTLFIGTYVVYTRISDVDIHFVLFLVEHVDAKHPFNITYYNICFTTNPIPYHLSYRKASTITIYCDKYCAFLVVDSLVGHTPVVFVYLIA